MASTRVENLFNPCGELKLVYVDLDGLASYTTGGQVLTAGELGLRQIVHAQAGASDNSAHFCSVAHATKGTQVGTTVAGGQVKVMWNVSSTGVEVAGAVNLSARFVRVAVWGR